MASSHTPTINGDINGKAGKHAAAVSITAVDRVTLTINHLTINGLLSQKQEQQEHGSAASFRNIMFAEIPGRWHEARLLDVQSQKGFMGRDQLGAAAAPDCRHDARNDGPFVSPAVGL
ncbi:hypothetical protein J3458_019608 [Metarhizium acridum]|uniref:uncharacterized protein n=1 Tax=Metarhizium acridum TaxID=92637 RepID=UPI001C6AEB51|nr:hypothetical protein J3458_019608 [Metarhizium acridum]